MHPLKQHLIEVIEHIFLAFLKLPVGECAAEFCSNSNSFCVSLKMSGAWSGELIVNLPEQLAARIAHAFYGVGSQTPSDIADATAEFGNMIGGNIKSRIADCLVLGSITRLSLPTVTRGDPFPDKPTPTRLIDLSLQSNSDIFQVLLIQAEQQEGMKTSNFVKI